MLTMLPCARVRKCGSTALADVEGGAHRALELALVVGPGERVERLALLGIEAVGREGVVHQHVDAAGSCHRSTSARACSGHGDVGLDAKASPPACRHACATTLRRLGARR
jgi:hypothetical protein